MKGVRLQEIYNLPMTTSGGMDFDAGRLASKACILQTHERFCLLYRYFQRGTLCHPTHHQATSFSSTTFLFFFHCPQSRVHKLKPSCLPARFTMHILTSHLWDGCWLILSSPFFKSPSVASPVYRIKCVVFSMTFTAFTFSLKCPTSFPPSLLSPIFLSLHKYVVGPILGTAYDFSNKVLLLLSFFSRLLFPTHYTILCASGNLFKYHSSSLILVAVISST